MRIRNDIDRWSGGYIIVGVDMESGLPEVESTADAPIDEKIVSILGAEGCMRVLDLSLRLGYKGINSTVRSAIGRLMAEGAVEYLYPDAPRSPKQRVCLVSKRRSRHRPGSFRSDRRRHIDLGIAGRSVARTIVRSTPIRCFRQGGMMYPAVSSSYIASNSGFLSNSFYKNEYRFD